MLALAIVFLVIAIVAAYFGFRGGANNSWEGAKLVFVLFLVLAIAIYASRAH